MERMLELPPAHILLLQRSAGDIFWSVRNPGPVLSRVSDSISHTVSGPCLWLTAPTGLCHHTVCGWPCLSVSPSFSLLLFLSLTCPPTQSSSFPLTISLFLFSFLSTSTFFNSTARRRSQSGQGWVCKWLVAVWGFPESRQPHGFWASLSSPSLL